MNTLECSECKVDGGHVWDCSQKPKFVLLCGIQYEGSNLIGVFDTLEQVERAKEKVFGAVDYWSVHEIIIGKIYSYGVENE